MDVRALGSYYPQTASLPYASGHPLTISGRSHNFAACRAVYINDGTANHDLQVVFADGLGIPVTLKRVTPNDLLPLSIVTISGAQTTVAEVVLLY
jgi:hypothetical protein